MNQEKLNNIRSLFEELNNIVCAARPGGPRQPVWDGTVIGKPNQRTLEKMGLVECCHCFYFPTEKGKEIWTLFCKP